MLNLNHIEATQNVTRKNLEDSWVESSSRTVFSESVGFINCTVKQYIVALTTEQYAKHLQNLKDYPNAGSSQFRLVREYGFGSLGGIQNNRPENISKLPKEGVLILIDDRYKSKENQYPVAGQIIARFNGDNATVFKTLFRKGA